MGTIQSLVTNTSRMLAECTVVGRAPSCDLRLRAAAVSGEHAAIRWTHGGWRVFDLGSRNGTWVDGKRLAHGASIELERGTSVGFGSPTEAWMLEDDGRPVAFVRSEQAELEVEGFLVLPSPERPLLEFTRAGDGSWRVEDSNGARVAVDRNTYSVDGVDWRLYLPSELPCTAALDGDFTMADASLTVRHDQTEEHIVATLSPIVGAQIDLGHRAHHAVLLELVRARLEDRASGIARAEEGWIHREDLSRRLRIDVNHVNIHVHRLRKQVASSGVLDAHGIVERRPRSGLMRIGPGSLRVASSLGTSR